MNNISVDFVSKQAVQFLQENTDLTIEINDDNTGEVFFKKT